jgi:glycerol uptake facilitator-like aquaporin
LPEHGIPQRAVRQLSERHLGHDTRLKPDHATSYGEVQLLRRARIARLRSSAVPFAVAAYITAAYWFTASTSFANPAVTLARSATDTFAGIRPSDAPPFIVAQLLGPAAATGLFRWLVPSLPEAAPAVVIPHAKVIPSDSRTGS